ncbi:MAG: type III-B CRISPR module RAMP protein Cmr6 [Pseudomonadota bacterium]
MPIAAVPAYLGTDFKDASPGMRFGMYLKLWGVNRRTHALLWETHDIDYEIRGQNRQEREVKKENKVGALSDAKSLNRRDKDVMNALATRQSTLAATVPAGSLLRLDALAIAPFTTGLGNEHPLENGFAFLNPYGLPYLPGSGVKGVLRQAARELASGEWGEKHGWDALLPSPSGRGAGGEGVFPIDALFGLESKDGDKTHVRGALTFWDVIPQIKGDSLMVEIMTPHQSHYYQWRKDQRGNPIPVAPHESGQPTPISFLTVPPGSGFTFHVVCDLAHLNRIAPQLAENDQWKTLLAAAFEHAFQWLGFGAKTAVGYGAMASDAMRRAKEEEMAARREAERQAGEQRKQERVLANAETWEGARIKFNRANQSLTVEKNNKTAIALAPLGASLLASLPPDMRRKIETGQFVKVTARVSGNDLLEVGP